MFGVLKIILCLDYFYNSYSCLEGRIICLPKYGRDCVFADNLMALAGSEKYLQSSIEERKTIDTQRIQHEKE